MSKVLQEHISRLIKISEQEQSQILRYFTSHTFGKKQNLHEAGKICKSNYFVEKGCLRMFFINEKGVEQTVQFALENWWLSDYTSFTAQKPSDFYIQAVEKSQIISLDYQAQEKMLQEFPVMERYFRLIHQRVHAASQYRLKALFSQTREEIYREFVKQYPEFIQRIPQYLLASFLGFTPEYLSELRAKKLS
ncbi:MAG TPA: Crp/Fnr family transcriptional regulator [Flavisolibacter sp.]|nr:Crp/Fnr family transcriptional regulator [Flavisolibacter sp.]